MPVDSAEIGLTKEPSGEIRLRVLLPDRHGRRGGSRAPVAAKAAGCGALVYRRKLREKLKERAGHGGSPTQTEFGRRAKRSVKNGCGAMEATLGRRILFATVTLPGSTIEARQAICKWSAKIVELLTHWISSLAKGAMYCYVWERQKNGALHLHAAIGHEDVLKLRALERNFKEYVHRMFSTVSRLSGIDLFARSEGGSWKGCVQVLRSNCVPVRKSVKRYMSKYITKGAGVVSDSFPSRWWGWSRKLRALVGELRRGIHRRIPDWEQAVQLVQTCISAVVRRACKWYSFSPPFTPSSCTLLIYPEDQDVERVFAELLAEVQALPAVEKRLETSNHDGFPIARFYEPGVEVD